MLNMDNTHCSTTDFKLNLDKQTNDLLSLLGK